MSKPRQFVGTWEVVELSDISEKRLRETHRPHLTIRPPESGAAVGEYAFGRRSGTVSGRFERVSENRHVFIFSFEGLGDGDEEHGAGVAWLEDEHRMVGRLIYHLGRIAQFVCRRTPEAAE